MFFLIPFGIFIISLSLIAWLFARKFIYLKKLVPGVIDNLDITQESFLKEFFPELIGRLETIKLREYGAAILVEFEKFLRKLRLISLRVDTFMSQLVHKIRRSNTFREEILNKEIEPEAEKEVNPLIRVNGANKKNFKEEEQKLIIEIAKSPKDAELYKKLGNIYMKTEEWHDAFESFKKALELDPGDASIKIKLERVSKKIEKLPG